MDKPSRGTSEKPKQGKNMPLSEAIQYHDSLPAHSTIRATLGYMIDHAVGHENAISKGNLMDRMSDQGVIITPYRLDKYLIKPSREGLHFIGVKRCVGIYLVDSEEDALVTLRFYLVQRGGLTNTIEHIYDLGAGNNWDLSGEAILT